MRKALLSGRSLSAENVTTLKRYFNDINRTEPLSKSRELELYRKIQKGDKKAEHELIVSNLRFVVNVAKIYTGSGLPLEDLIQIGNEGLIRAVRKFDATKNFRFISYAVWWIRQGILQAISKQSRLIKLPVNQTAILVRILEAQDKFLQKHKRTPTIEELSKVMKYPAEKILRTIELAEPTTSLDTPVGTAGDVTLGDILPDSHTENLEDQILNRLSDGCVEEMLQTLDERQKLIISLYFGIHGSSMNRLEDISDVLGITRERVRQLKDRGLATLRRHTDYAIRLRQSILDRDRNS